ncbi:hypothetical protein [Niabella hirudinis]|uniref:hypothetical protein n=1 Tax=Niabella hirudinis TaxID=1285929 RepID=UPI003EBAF009
MRTVFLIAFCVIHVITAVGQSPSSPFRKGYTRLGIQLPGNKLEYSLSPKENALKGNFGSDMGFVFEKGRLFYFISKDKAKLINAGIDWTILALNATITGNSWKDYVKNTTGYADDEFTSKLVASVATKAGPVLSINPVQDLVIDVRAQVSLGAYAIGPVYESYSADGSTLNNAFYPFDYNEDATGIKTVTQGFHTILKPNIGATVRWRGIGLAADVSPGNFNMKYKAIENGTESMGEQKVPFNTFQVKLSFNGK